jgi:hypothetical protein
MRRLSILSALAVTASLSYADDYRYLIKEPQPTARYSGSSDGSSLVLSAAWRSSFVPQMDTYFSGRSFMPSNTSELNARKPDGVMIIIR